MFDLLDQLRIADDPGENICSRAANEIDRLGERCKAYKGQIEAGANEIARLRAALEFYRDERRYFGPNQKPIPGDPYAPSGLPYIYDVTRDQGEVARRALEQTTLPAK